MRKTTNHTNLFPVALDKKIVAKKIRMKSAIYKSMKVVRLEIKYELNVVLIYSEIGSTKLDDSYLNK